MIPIAVLAALSSVTASAVKAEPMPAVTVHESSNAPHEGEDSAVLRITGRVQGAPESTLFVVTARNLYFRVSIGPKTLPAHPELHSGDHVRVVGELLGPDRIVADTVTVLEKRTEPLPNLLAGTVRSIDLKQRRLVLATAAGTPTVEWAEGTRFVRSNEPAGAEALKPGDSVHVFGHPVGTESLLARRIVVGTAAGFTNGALGEVVSVDRERRQARVDFSGEVWTARLDTNELYRDHERVEVDALQLGQEVHVFGASHGSRSIDVERLVIVKQ